MSRISICIPTYEFKGKGVFYLNQLLESLKVQTFKDFDVVISDHSSDDKIFEFVKQASDEFDITFIKNSNGRGFQATNTNCALENAEGEIIKLIYQDDLFVNERALELIHTEFKHSNKCWLMNGFVHTVDGANLNRPMVPIWSDYLLEGRNLLGSPSCFACLNDSKMFMDEHIKLLIDTDLYHRMRLKYGLPIILSEILISNREHPDRVSSSGINYNFMFEHPDGSWLVNKQELDYVTEKHKNSRGYPDET